MLIYLKKHLNLLKIKRIIILFRLDFQKMKIKILLKMKKWCLERCQLNITKTGDNKIIFECDDNYYPNPSSIISVKINGIEIPHFNRSKNLYCCQNILIIFLIILLASFTSLISAFVLLYSNLTNLVYHSFVSSLGFIGFLLPIFVFLVAFTSRILNDFENGKTSFMISHPKFYNWFWEKMKRKLEFEIANINNFSKSFEIEIIDKKKNRHFIYLNPHVRNLTASEKMQNVSDYIAATPTNNNLEIEYRTSNYVFTPHLLSYLRPSSPIFINKHPTDLIYYRDGVNFCYINFQRKSDNWLLRYTNFLSFKTLIDNDTQHSYFYCKDVNLVGVSESTPIRFKQFVVKKFNVVCYRNNINFENLNNMFRFLCDRRINYIILKDIEINETFVKLYNYYRKFFSNFYFLYSQRNLGSLKCQINRENLISKIDK